VPQRGDAIVFALLAGLIAAVLIATPAAVDLSWTGDNLLDLHARGRFGAFYPPTLLIRATNSPTTAIVMFGAHLAFSAIGMYLLVVKRFGMGGAGGIVAAVTWTLTGFPLSFAERPWVIFPLAWLPWTIIFADFYKLQPQWKTGTALLCLLTLPFYAGDLRTAVLVPIAVVLYLGGFIWPGAAGMMGMILRTHLRKNLPRAGAVWLAAIAPAAVPMFFIAPATTVEPQVFAAGGWLEFLLPGLDDPARDTLAIARRHDAISLSLWHAPLLYALVGAGRWCNPMRGPTTLMAVVCTAAAIASGALGWGGWAVAGLGLLGWAILAGGGADHVFTTSAENRARLTAPMVAAFVPAVTAAVTAFVRWPHRFAPLFGLTAEETAPATEDLAHAAAIWGATALSFATFALGVSRQSLFAGLATLLLAFGALGHDVYHHARSLLVSVRSG
jgi:hypothetical protein